MTKALMERVMIAKSRNFEDDLTGLVINWIEYTPHTESFNVIEICLEVILKLGNQPEKKASWPSEYFKVIDQTK